MKRLFRLLLVVPLFGASFLIASPASANHGDQTASNNQCPGPTQGKDNFPLAGTHESAPLPVPVVPDTTGVALGKVTTDGLDPGAHDVTHGHYEFVSATVTAVGAHGGDYAVNASGGFDGPDQLDSKGDSHSPAGSLVHGSHNAVAWSHSRNANGTSNGTNEGKISVTNSLGQTSTGSVKFVRVLTNVTAWGTVAGPAGNFNFLADLEFTPEPNPGCASAFTSATYDLRGVWLAA